MAVEAKAILSAVVVVKIPVGIIVIKPPFVEIGEGAVIVAIAVVPETNKIGVVGAIVVAEATVGAPAVVPIAIVPFAPTAAMTALLLFRHSCKFAG